jgi:hypothetical protein
MMWEQNSERALSMDLLQRTKMFVVVVVVLLVVVDELKVATTVM